MGASWLRARTGAVVLVLLPWAAASAERSAFELVSDLDSDSREVSRHAYEALAALGTDAVPALRTKVRSRSLGGCIARFLLGYIGPEAAAALPDLLEAARGGDCPAAWAVTQISTPAAGPAIPVLERCLEGASALDRKLAVASLGRIGPGARAALPAMKRALSDSDVDVRLAAAAALPRVAGPGSLAELRLMLSRERDARARAGVAAVIAQAGGSGPEIVETLVTAAGAGDESTAAEALEALARLGPRAVSAVPALVSLDRHPDEARRVGAVSTLAAIQLAEALPAAGLLKAALRSASPSVRRTACLGLGRLGPLAMEAHSALEALAGDPDAAVRAAAAWAADSVLRHRRARPSSAGLRLRILADADDGPVAVFVDDQHGILALRMGDSLQDTVVSRMSASGVTLERIPDGGGAARPGPVVFRLAPTAERAAPVDSTTDTGRPISADLDDDLADFLRMMADISGLNVALQASVESGSMVSLLARDKPWDWVFVQGLEQLGLAYELDGSFIRVGTRPDLEQLRPRRHDYTGHRISLDFRAMSWPRVVSLFAKISGLRFQVDPDVDDRPVTLKCLEVPWDEAFDVVLGAKKLAYELREDSVLIHRLAPAPRPQAGQAHQPAE